VLADADFNGQPRQMPMQASRNGYFFVLDRTNRKSLLTARFATVNWVMALRASDGDSLDASTLP
jgi:alcohol dehydrogenase (cytochrome c)